MPICIYLCTNIYSLQMKSARCRNDDTYLRAHTYKLILIYTHIHSHTCRLARNLSLTRILRADCSNRGKDDSRPLLLLSSPPSPLPRPFLLPGSQ